MTRCVVDTGVVIAWFVDETGGGPTHGDAALDLLAHHARGWLEIHSPELMLAEAANVFWKLSRFRGYPPAGAAGALAWLGRCDLRLHPHRPVVGPALALAQRFGCTVYDGLYVALAEQLRAPLVTSDERLVERLRPALPWVCSLGEL